MAHFFKTLPEKHFDNDDINTLNLWLITCEFLTLSLDKNVPRKWRRRPENVSAFGSRSGENLKNEMTFCILQYRKNSLLHFENNSREKW